MEEEENAAKFADKEQGQIQRALERRGNGSCGGCVLDEGQRASEPSGSCEGPSRRENERIWPAAEGGGLAGKRRTERGRRVCRDGWGMLIE